MRRVLILDPGNHTGWLYVRYDNQGNRIKEIYGGTIGENHEHVGRLINILDPDTIIYETFQLYPNKANHMQWNSFYPCEVIGVIKYIAVFRNIPLVGLQPAVKKYAGVTDQWKEIQTAEKLNLTPEGKPEKAFYGDITEHTRDTYRLWKYWERNIKK